MFLRRFRQRTHRTFGFGGDGALDAAQCRIGRERQGRHAVAQLARLEQVLQRELQQGQGVGDASGAQGVGAQDLVEAAAGAGVAFKREASRGCRAVDHLGQCHRFGRHEVESGTFFLQLQERCFRL